MPHPSITAETYPHKPAIIMGGTGEMVTYQQLDERSNQGAQLFRSLGLKTGDHIGMMMENNRQFLEIAWADALRGLTEGTAFAVHVSVVRPLTRQPGSAHAIGSAIHPDPSVPCPPRLTGPAGGGFRGRSAVQQRLSADRGRHQR